MSQHVTRSSPARRARQSWSDLLAWHDRRPRASMSSPRGWMWAALIAASFFWMSNPLVFVRVFDDSVAHTVTWTLVVAVLTLPWLRLPRVPWPWLSFLALCALSQLWTINDASTDTSIVLYVKLTALAVIVAANCDAEVVGLGLGLGGVVVVALSIYAFEKTMWGSSYPDHFEGTELVLTFAGVGTNENILAYTLTVALAGISATWRPRHWAMQTLWFGVLAANGYGLYLANSGTGYLTVLCLLGATTAIVAAPRLSVIRRHVLAASAAIVLTLVVVAVFVVTVSLDKQLSTVSGRAPLWAATFSVTMDRAPLLGSGWGAVWERPWDLAPPNPVAAEIYERAGLALAHGHNFFVDVLPELGLLGIVVVLLMLTYAVREVGRCGLRAGSSDPTSGPLALLVTIALLVSGVAEPMLTVPIGWWSWALVVAVCRQRAPDPQARSLGRGRHVATEDARQQALA